MITAIVLAAVTVALVIVGQATPKGIENREYTKETIRTMLWEPVYKQGMSLDAARAKYPEIYRNHPNLFVQYYQDLLSVRAADLEAGIHPMSGKKSERLYQEYMILAIIVIMLLFINEIYN